MGDLSFAELLVIFLVIIILFGPKKIPEIARGLGLVIRKTRGTLEEIKQEVMKETEEENPIDEIKKEIEKVEEHLMDKKQGKSKKHS